MAFTSARDLGGPASFKDAMELLLSALTSAKLFFALGLVGEFDFTDDIFRKLYGLNSKCGREPSVAGAGSLKKPKIR